MVKLGVCERHREISWLIARVSHARPGNEKSVSLSVREAAEADKKLRFNNLLHHVSVELMLDSFYELKRQSAPGMEGVTWAEYAQGLEVCNIEIGGHHTFLTFLRAVGGSRFPEPSFQMISEEKP